MCGICGVFGHNTGDFGDRVTRMMTSIRHRGPDGSGLLEDEVCSFGHQRLAILDLSDRGHQPMLNESGRIWSIVNGEIYNYKDLRFDLKNKGHTFRSECDSEVLTHLYEEYGSPDFLNLLHGMFSLAIYDARSESLILARDPVGKKPLYYGIRGDTVFFASEIKALFEAGFPKRVNYEAIPSWMLYQYTIGENTLFKYVLKVRPGTVVTFSHGSHATHPYWRPRGDFDPVCSDPAIESDCLRRNLDQATKLRLQSDVPIGSFLSGGIDSAAVTALYRRQYSGDLHTFTASFENKSEVSYAKTVSNHLRTEFHEVPITPDMVYDDIEEITWHFDEPIGDAAIICNYYLAKEAKKYVTVVLAGEGGDELFGGYPWYPYSRLLDVIGRVPYQIRKPFSKIISGDVTSRAYLAHRLLSMLGQPSKEETLLYPTTTMSRGGVEWVLGKGDYHWSGHRGVYSRSPYNRMMELDFLNLLPEKFLMKADKATMAFAIEERLPLLDNDVVRVALQMTPSLKKKKLVLRQAVSDLLPAEIVWRPKQGFGTPYDRWMCDPGKFRRLVIDRLKSGRLIKAICDPQSLSKITNHLQQNRNDNHGRMALGSTNVLWSLFSLQIWHDVWFGGQS